MVICLGTIFQLICLSSSKKRSMKKEESLCSRRREESVVALPCLPRAVPPLFAALSEEEAMHLIYRMRASIDDATEEMIERFRLEPKTNDTRQRWRRRQRDLSFGQCSRWTSITRSDLQTGNRSIVQWWTKSLFYSSESIEIRHWTGIEARTSDRSWMSNDRFSLWTSSWRSEGTRWIVSLVRWMFSFSSQSMVWSRLTSPFSSVWHIRSVLSSLFVQRRRSLTSFGRQLDQLREETRRENKLKHLVSANLSRLHRIVLLDLSRWQEQKETLTMSVLSLKKDFNIFRRNFDPFVHWRKESISNLSKRNDVQHPVTIQWDISISFISIVIHRPLNKNETETNGNQLSCKMSIHVAMLSCLSGDPKHNSPLLCPSQFFWF